MRRRYHLALTTARSCCACTRCADLVAQTLRELLILAEQGDKHAAIAAVCIHINDRPTHKTQIGEVLICNN